MDQVKQKQLMEKYPGIFRDKDKSMRKTAMCWGIETGDGWYELLDQLCGSLKLIQDITGIHVVADQVKEKFGGLRFYYHLENLENCRINEDYRQAWQKSIQDLVSTYERLAEYTCEGCGAQGQAVPGGWIVTLCEDCKNTRGEDRKNV